MEKINGHHVMEVSLNPDKEEDISMLSDARQKSNSRNSISAAF